MADHGLLVGVGLQALEQALAAFLLLLGVRERTGRRTRETGMEAERSHTTTRRRVLEELEVVQCALSLSEPAEDVIPSPLVLIAVRELDVGVGKRVTETYR
jgi:hypothetical protein